MTCEQARALVPELALGIASGEERAAALAHMGECAECRRELERLTEVADELSMLVPEHDPPAGFESRMLDRIAPAPPKPAKRWRRRAALVAAAGAGAAIAAGALLIAFNGDRELAGEYRATLAEAGGKELMAAKLYRAGDVREGVAFAYEGAPSWVVVTLKKPWDSTDYRAELVTKSGDRVPIAGFRLNPKTGTWGGEIPIDLDRVSELRLLGSERGDVLEAEF